MGKYFKYAIGEIILVMIGILLALQVNNWNENRQNKQRVDRLLNKIKKDIEKDLSEIFRISRFYARKDSLSYLVINNKLTKEDYESEASGSLHYLIFNYDILSLKNNSYTNLLRHQDIIPEEYDELMEKLYVLYGDYYNYVHDFDDELSEDTERFDNYLFQTHDWYSSHPFNLNEERIDYFLNNVRYKGMVREYRSTTINNYLDLNINYAYAAIDAYRKINEVLNIEESDPLFDFKTDSKFIGTYRTFFDLEFRLVKNGHRIYMINDIDTTNAFQYDTNKMYVDQTFARFEEVNDSIKVFVSAHENGVKPYAIKID